ncbi:MULTISPECIES: hypothetical protein [unclassified Paenibacillus]|uniref:hypothetical protein n=1 Tax=unclassified Paenibacillus TaxID=185978 RepID=UPI000954D72A|nr:MULTISPECIES: hypothetical protein [unclassified Paenibacillus]ASS67421.1 hypothetical protein CIC07_15690 [Paenibacillus sp. RUD330]SIQ77553.1 hypothetical protein SAMN05880555_2292 [Paenibacillus sp. RU4X]SIQ99005.1 hypothetical protein SAMN05880570_2291 [Paenibacillus sp. RU4T]
MMNKTWKRTAGSLLALTMALSGGGAVFALEGQPAPAAGEAAITAVPANAAAVKKMYNEYIRLASSSKTLSQAVAYLNKHIGEADKWTGSMMVLRLENAQTAGLESLQNRIAASSVQKSIDAAWRKGSSGSIDSLIKNAADEKTKKLLGEARSQGYRISTAEGMYFPEIDYVSYEAYKSHVGADIAAYIAMMSLETSKPTLRDAAIIIGWGELLQRNLAQEKFLRSYPSSNRKAKVESMYRLTKWNVFYGSNNTPLFDYESKVINAKAVEAYKKAVADGDVSKSPLLLKLSNFLKVSDRNGGKLTDELSLWRSKQIPMQYN